MTFNSTVDGAYEAGKRAASREWMSICIQLMKVTGVTQIEVPTSVLVFDKDRLVISKSDDGTLYRIKGTFVLEPSHE